MGTVLQDRSRNNDHKHHLPASHNRVKRKASGSISSRRNTKPDVPQNTENETEKDSLATENGFHPQDTRRISTAAVIHSRAIPNKCKVSSVKKHPIPERPERRYRPKTRQSSEKDVLPSRKSPVPAPRLESTERVIYEDTDSGTDLSDTERLAPPTVISHIPQLHLREEIIDESDFQPTRTVSRSHVVFRDRYPDFLPPPFNSWSLRELAVYLNMEGKDIPRSRPVNQFERYLDRLLQLEWQKILMLQEESSKSSWTERRRPHSSLSAPKSILQCHRAFPFTLLTSVHPQSCTYPKHSNLPTETSRRSSSETRAHRHNRLSDSSVDYVKRMQAIGNIRNPITTHSSHVNSPVGVDQPSSNIKKKKSHSCGNQGKDGCRRARPERGTETRRVPDSKSFSATSSVKEPVVGRNAVKNKNVGFVFQEQVRDIKVLI